MIRIDGVPVRFTTFSTRVVGLLDACIAGLTLIILLTAVTAARIGCGEICLLLGINVQDYLIYYDDDKNITMECDKNISQNSTVEDLRLEKFQTLMVSCYMFALCQLASSVLLVWATVELNWWKVLPWYFCKIATITIETYGCVNYYTYIYPYTNKFDTGIIIIVMAVLCMISVTHSFTGCPAMIRRRFNRGAQERAEEGANPTRRPSEQQPLLGARADPGSLHDEDAPRRPVQPRLQFKHESEESGSSGDNGGDESESLLSGQRPKRRNRFRTIAKALTIFLKPKKPEEKEMETFVENT